jgi:hypothetical protein
MWDSCSTAFRTDDLKHPIACLDEGAKHFAWDEMNFQRPCEEYAGTVAASDPTKVDVSALHGVRAHGCFRSSSTGQDLRARSAGRDFGPIGCE